MQVRNRLNENEKNDRKCPYVFIMDVLLYLFSGFGMVLHMSTNLARLCQSIFVNSKHQLKHAYFCPISDVGTDDPMKDALSILNKEKQTGFVCKPYKIHLHCMGAKVTQIIIT